MINKLICWLRGHIRDYWSDERCDAEDVMDGLFKPYVCLRCGFKSQTFKWPRFYQEVE